MHVGIYFGLANPPAERTSPARIYDINTVYFWALVGGAGSGLAGTCSTLEETVARHVRTVCTETGPATGIGK